MERHLKKSAILDVRDIREEISNIGDYNNIVGLSGRLTV
jgi:hypothetical protein